MGLGVPLRPGKGVCSVVRMWVVGSWDWDRPNGLVSKGILADAISP